MLICLNNKYLIIVIILVVCFLSVLDLEQCLFRLSHKYILAHTRAQKVPKSLSENVLQKP